MHHLFPKDHRGVIVLFHLGFFLTGIVNTFIGPLLPALATKWQLNDAQAAYLLTAQSLGGMIGSTLSGFLTKKAGFKTPVVLGYALMALSVAGLIQSSWYLGLTAALSSGIALGFVIPPTTLMISELAQDNRAKALNILNLFWGLGAVAAPLLLASLIHISSLAKALFSISILLLLFSVVIALRLKHHIDFSSTKSATKFSFSVNTLVILLAFGIMVFIYVGIESSIGGWLTTYAKRLSLSSPFYWSTTTAMFWVGLISGRTIAPIFLQSNSEFRLILFGIIIAIIGQASILLTDSLFFVSIGAMIAGFGLAPIFPTLLAIFTKQVSEEATNIIGVLFTFAGLGGAVYPWLIGLTALHSGQLRTALFIPFLSSFLLMLFFLAISRTAKRT